MSVLKKARQILRVQGPLGFLQRGNAKLRRSLAARSDARVRRRAWRALLSCAKTGPVYFPRHDKPLVSIVIPVYNNVTPTAKCLNAVLRELDSLTCEVIVVDDASTDGTAAYLDSCSGIQVVRHDAHQGFAESANDGARVARGRYLHFLSSDTIVTPNWLRPLLETFESRARVGAAGSQLRAPDGRIAEAGGVLWRDGSNTSYGRGRRSAEPGVAFPRDVDYCSTTSLMLRADLFRDIGGFASEFAHAHHIDADLCLRLQGSGHRVVYQPDSVVLGTDAIPDTRAVNSDRPAHRQSFVRKWRLQLATHFPPDKNLIERAARRIAGKRTVLVMDSFVPFDEISAGARRILAIMRLMRESDWHVIFISDDGGEYEPYTSRARRAGIEVLPHRGDAAATIRALTMHIDLAWISRPDVLQRYLPILRASTAASIVYDTVDLHFVRRQREQVLTGQPTHWEAMQSIELDLARKTDHTVVTTEEERLLLTGLGVNSSVIPIIETPVATNVPYHARHGLLFLGNYTHEPNVDAATWMVGEIMPLIWERIPNMRFVLAGADPTPSVQRLANDRVSVTGFVPEVRGLFEAARVFVAPLRFGAGMKGKVVQSIAHGLPVVTTGIGAEGIGLVDGASALIRDDVKSFAEAIMHLYNDEALWKQFSQRALDTAQNFSAEAVKARLDQTLQTAIDHQVHVGVDVGLSAHSA